MTEIIGALACRLTLASLFKASIEAFDLIQAAQNQEINLKKLSLRLNIEKSRLYNWGQEMGLTGFSTGATNALEGCQYQGLVRQALELIVQLFHNTNKLKDKYGCRKHARGRLPPVQTQIPGPVQNLAGSFSNFRISSRQSTICRKILQKTQRLIGDHKKFGVLIGEIRDMIDGLRHITEDLVTVAQQEHTIKNAVRNIEDVETLNLVAEV